MCRRYCHVASPSHVLCPTPPPASYFRIFLPPHICPLRQGGEGSVKVSKEKQKGRRPLPCKVGGRFAEDQEFRCTDETPPTLCCSFSLFETLVNFFWVRRPSAVSPIYTSYIAVHVHLRTHRGTRAHRQSGHGKDLFIGGPLPSSLSYKSGFVCQRRARAVARANSTRAKRRILPMLVQHLFSCQNNLRIEKQRETFLSVPLVFDQYENGEHHSFVLAQFTGGAHNPVYTVYRECNKRLWRRLTCLFSLPSLPHARTWRPFRCSPSARRRPRRFRWRPRGRCCGG